MRSAVFQTMNWIWKQSKYPRNMFPFERTYKLKPFCHYRKLRKFCSVSPFYYVIWFSHSWICVEDGAIFSSALRLIIREKQVVCCSRWMLASRGSACVRACVCVCVSGMMQSCDLCHFTFHIRRCQVFSGTLSAKRFANFSIQICRRPTILSNFVLQESK